MSVMTAQPADEGDILDDLPDDLLPDAPDSAEAAGATRETSAAPVIPLVTPLASQIGAEAAENAGTPQTAAQASAARLAQIVNLHIAGYSLAQIGAAIGASAEEVDRMLTADATRYVRTQPALRTYVRNWISGKFTTMIEANWKHASDPTSNQRLENQDRVIRMLDSMGKLHGAHAPVQSEVKITEAPEAVEKLVHALSQANGIGYDADVFDVEFTEDVHEADVAAQGALAAAGEAVEDDQPEDEENPL